MEAKCSIILDQLRVRAQKQLERAYAILSKRGDTYTYHGHKNGKPYDFVGCIGSHGLVVRMGTEEDLYPSELICTTDSGLWVPLLQSEKILDLVLGADYLLTKAKNEQN